jgi:4-hydroxymandelate oxidase
MGMIENRWRFSLSRRDALASLAAMLAGSPLLHGQLDPHGDMRGHKRIPGFDDMVTAFDFEPVCYANITLDRAEYMQHGDGSEWNMRRNREAFDWVDIVPGKAVDPRSVDLSSTLLGIKLTHPVLVAPTSQQGPLHPEGEAGMYKGTTGANTIMAIANGPSIPHEKIAAAATGVRWNQFYPTPNLDTSRETIARFHDLGTRSVIITVDQQASTYERDLHLRNLGGAPRKPGQARGAGAGGAGGGRGGGPARGPVTSGPALYRLGVPGRLWYTWDYVNEIRKVCKVPVIIKGIVTAEDAADCVKQGVDGIVISNHGGRSMDYGPSTLEVIPEIAAVVNGRIPIIVDSGFRRGSDVFKALALGANAVELGRAARWGLGAFGPAGAQRVLEIIQEELVQAAAFAGCANLQAIGKSNVKTNFV